MKSNDDYHSEIENNVVNEPKEAYQRIDPFEELFIKYLKYPRIQEELENIYEKIKKK